MSISMPDAFTVIDLSELFLIFHYDYNVSQKREIEILLFRWQDDLRRYNTYPKKRTAALKRKIFNKYKKLIIFLLFRGA